MDLPILDRIVAWERGSWVRAEKRLTGEEPYLADHFPGTPVMPGVLILEAMAQAGDWLLRLTRPDAPGGFSVRGVRGVKFMRFVRPGETMEVSVRLGASGDDGRAELLCQAEVGGRPAASARMALVPAHGLDAHGPETPGHDNGRPFRWLWVDRFTGFHAGHWAEAAKQVPSGGRNVLGHVCPNRLTSTLVLEGLAQTGGLLVFDAVRFQLAPILAKVAKAEFFFEPAPGEMLAYTAVLDGLGDDGAAVTVASSQAGRAHAKAQILFALLGAGRPGEPTIDPAVFYTMMCDLAAFDVPTEGRPVRPADAVAAAATPGPLVRPS